MHHPSHTLPQSRGYILVLALVFLGIFFTTATAYLDSVTGSARGSRTNVASAQALALAEAGLDQAAYQLNQNSAYSGEASTTLGNGAFTVTVSAVDSSTKLITSTGYVPNTMSPLATKTVKAKVGVNNDVISFHYGIQSGNGGFYLDNQSSVSGNVFSSGSVIGTSQNYIYGDVISSGASGLVYGIHATSSVYAHTIGNSSETTIIDKDAYYATTKTNTSVGGTSHPSSPDQATTSLPISDAQISAWESMAVAGGTKTCSGGSYNISSGSVTLGPVKIPCDLNISNSAIVTVAGHLWVAGNITVQNSAQVRMAPALGATNVAIIADDPTDHYDQSVITVANTATFVNSGTPGSFIFLISQNSNAEQYGGNIPAFTLSNSASALVAYAAHGLIPLANNVSLKEVTAYKIRLQNQANVTYDTGLPHAVFQSGPGGSWGFIPGTYAITR